jgi:alkylation response protein AidB-like acyl-CoA dehydrogenase
MPAFRTWFAALFEAGFLGRDWPVEWGGDPGHTPLHDYLFDGELGAAQAPTPVGAWRLVATSLFQYGTEAQRRRYLPAIRTASEIWCQLFSEPEAGSDLASLKTRAERDGEEYVVNGQKVWTTLAHVARFGILLARTDPDAAAQEGITYFVVDMQTPGIEVRPLVQMTGTHEFNEVFFTDVRVPARNVVGVEHDGWRLAKVTLGNERVSLSGEGALWGRGPTANDLIDLVRAHGGTSDPLLRQQVARLYSEAETLRLIRLRTLSAKLRGLEPGPEASVRKAIADEHGQHVMALAKALAGTHGLLMDHGPYAEADPGIWNYGYLYSCALTIGGGTSEVQRNILGEKVLGLPREPPV